MQALEHRNVDAQSIEAETEAEQCHDERRAQNVPAIEISSAHAGTLAAWTAPVSPFSDVIVPTGHRRRWWACRAPAVAVGYATSRIHEEAACQNTFRALGSGCAIRSSCTS